MTFTSVKHADYLIVAGDSPPAVGLGTTYFDEGAGTAAQAATSVTAVINALPSALWVNGAVTAAVDGTVAAQVDLTAASGTGLAGNTFTLAKTGTLVTSVSAATFSGASAVVSTDAVKFYVVALAALTGCQVDVYEKPGIVIGDLTTASDALYEVARYRNTEWGYLNQQ